MARAILRFLASLKLAIVLLVVLIAACARGTFLASDFNAEVARAYVYGAPWFSAWLGLLCMNLFCVAAVRYPWKPRLTGFVITHAGIITLLIGGIIDQHFGLEGHLRLYRGAPPTRVLELLDQELRVYASPEDPAPAATPFNAEVLLNSKDPSFSAATPSPEIQVQVRAIGPVERSLQGVEPSQAPDARPALRYALRSPIFGRMGGWIFLGEQHGDGAATYRFTRGPPPPRSSGASAKEETGKNGRGQKARRREVHLQFSQHPDFIAPKSLAGPPSGAKSKLLVDATNRKPRLQLTLMEKRFEFPVEPNLKRDLPLEGLKGWTLRITGYYPNFKMDMATKRPRSEGRKPLNPAVAFELQGPPAETGAMSAHSASRGHADPPSAGGFDPGANGITFFLGEDGKIRYLMRSKRAGEKRAAVELGRAIPIAWAPNAELVVERFLPQAKAQYVWRPLSKTAAAGVEMAGPSRGLLVRVTVGAKQAERWVPQTTPQSQRRQWVRLGGRTIGLAFCNRTLRLPFTVSLLSTRAPFEEGMENSSSFMSFESTLDFDGQVDTVRLQPGSKWDEFTKNRQDPSEPGLLKGAITEDGPEWLTLEFADGRQVRIPHAEIAEYRKTSQKISMNNPTTFPVSWWRPWLGLNYKFSQADHGMLHTPRDPNYSGVQVLRDPGWMPKWVGSLMICFGIFTMFYLKPYFRQTSPARKKRTEARTEGAAVPTDPPSKVQGQALVKEH